MCPAVHLYDQKFPWESEVYVEDVFYVIQKVLQRDSQHELLDKSILPKANELKNSSVFKKKTVLKSTQ